MIALCFLVPHALCFLLLFFFTLPLRLRSGCVLIEVRWTDASGSSCSCTDADAAVAAAAPPFPCAAE